MPRRAGWSPSALGPSPGEPHYWSRLSRHRGDLQRSEVFHEDDNIVLSVMRYNGTMLLEKIQHEGLFDLDRLDRGLKTKFEP